MTDRLTFIKNDLNEAFDKYQGKIQTVVLYKPETPTKKSFIRQVVGLRMNGYEVSLPYGMSSDEHSLMVHRLEKTTNERGIRFARF